MPKNQVVVRNAADLEKKYNFASLLGLKKNVETATQGIQKIENELNGMLNALVINLKDALDSQSEISLWFYSAKPTTSNEPYISWDNPNDHIGDIYYDQSTGYVYQWNGVWEVNTSPDLIEAMAITNAEIDTSTDHERKVFFDTPTIPYSNGDWWIKEDGSLFICQISKTSGTYETTDFIDSSNYTESIAEKIGEEIKVLKGTVTMINENYAKFTDLATGGNTTIAGENITTGNIQSQNYVKDKAGMKIALANGTIDSKNFKTDEEGNVYLGDGAKVIGGDGLLTNLQFESIDRYNGYSLLGFAYNSGTSFDKIDVLLDVYVPENFTVTEAYVTLYHTPVSWAAVEGETQSAVAGYCRNVKLYKSSSDTNFTMQAAMSSDYYIKTNNLSGTEISGAFGKDGYTATNTSSPTTEITKSSNIAESLKTGNNKLFLRTTQSTSSYASSPYLYSSDACSKTGLIKMIVDVVGYMSYE